MKPSNKIAFTFMGIVWLLYLAPFFVPVLNQLEPRLFGLPFTVWFMWIVIVVSWVIAIWSSKKVWDPFEIEESEDDV